MIKWDETNTSFDKTSHLVKKPLKKRPEHDEIVRSIYSVNQHMTSINMSSMINSLIFVPKNEK